MPAKRPKKDDEAAGLADLLEHLKSNRGFDFSGYKRGTLERRIQKRMDDVGVSTYRDYRDYLEVTPDEFTDLFNTILINVTGFFRDKPAWDYLSTGAVPEMLERLPDDSPIRVWSAACASGEEAYSTAMMLAEILGQEAFHRRVKIYATDVDEDALTSARHAVYGREAVKAVPDRLREKYFEASPSGFAFRGDMRRAVIFGRNDLVQDAPISRVDLLVSRNALMYFTAETQSRILARFNFALRDSGVLFLGKSEMLITHADLFKPISLKWRVFSRVPQGGLRERLSFIGGEARSEADTPADGLPAGALEVSRLAQVVVDRDGLLVMVNRRARELFDISATDAGRPLQDLELSYRPAELRAAIDQAYTRRAAVKLDRVPWKSGATELTLEIEVVPLAGADGALQGVTVGFDDVTEQALLDEEHRRAQSQLETAYDELQSTVEELETTNEELHSTNEELETTNEELQSTNEELETMNEELESTNHELEAMNDEQANRSRELDRLTVFLEGVLESLGLGVVVIDTEQHVLAWNGHSQELWGVRAGEVEGEHLMGLDIGLPVDELRPALRAVLSNGKKVEEVVLDAHTRRGKEFRCWVRVNPLLDAGGSLFGALILMADVAEREAGAVSI